MELRAEFRTTADWRECLSRYLAAIAVCSVLNFAITLSGFEALEPSQATNYAIIATVQIGMIRVKFSLYHFWI